MRIGEYFVMCFPNNVLRQTDRKTERQAGKVRITVFFWTSFPNNVVRMQTDRGTDGRTDRQADRQCDDH